MLSINVMGSGVFLLLVALALAEPLGAKLLAGPDNPLVQFAAEVAAEEEVGGAVVSSAMVVSAALTQLPSSSSDRWSPHGLQHTSLGRGASTDSSGAASASTAKPRSDHHARPPARAAPVARSSTG